MSTPPQPKQYNSAPSSYEWTRRAYDLLLAGDLEASIKSIEGVETARLDGKCPYCEDPIHVVYVRTAVTEGTRGAVESVDQARGAKAARRYGEIDVTCGCRETHPGDPKKGTGCGTNFRVRVLVQ